MRALTEYLIGIVENGGDDVPAYIRQHRPSKYEPEILLPKLSAEELDLARKNLNPPSEERSAASDAVQEEAKEAEVDKEVVSAVKSQNLEAPPSEVVEKASNQEFTTTN